MATDYRLWLLNELASTRKALQALITVACDRAEAEAGVLMPGFTHLQPAQTVRWGHWLMCHCSTWQRDDERLRDLLPRVAMLPLGSGALAGNPFLVDRQFLAKVRLAPRCHCCSVLAAGRNARSSLGGPTLARSRAFICTVADLETVAQP